MKLSEGFAKPGFTALIFIFYGVSFYFFSLTVKRMDLGAAYAIWAGLGTALIALIGVLYFRDGLDTLVEAGVTAVVEPGGSRNDQELIDAANEHGIALVFTGERHFRH